MAAAVEAEDKQATPACGIGPMLAGQASMASRQLWQFETFVGDVAFELLDQRRCPRTPPEVYRALDPGNFLSRVSLPKNKFNKPNKPSLVPKHNTLAALEA
eukprot:359839-Chlamydomonas_euryale.AAC.12